MKYLGTRNEQYDPVVTQDINNKENSISSSGVTTSIEDTDYVVMYEQQSSKTWRILWSQIKSKIETFIRAAFKTTPLPLDSGGTGATTSAAARSNLGITPENIGALPLTGGTVSGKIKNTYMDGTGIGIEISHTDAEKDCGIDIRKESSDKSGVMFIGVGGSGKTGIYSYTLNKWVFYTNGTSVYIDGQQYRHIYAGTAAPSGGSDGDVYIKYS